jgi:hypothetical protein
MAKASSKDAFVEAPTASTPEPIVPERTTKAWGRRLIVDGVEMDPETGLPITPKED